MQLKNRQEFFVPVGKSDGLLLQWHTDGDPEIRAVHGFSRYFSTVSRCDRLCDRKSDPVTAGFGIAGSIRAVKAVKQMRKVFV